MTNKSQQTKKGVSFIEGLQLLFIAFKLAHVIDWSWWLVLLPYTLKFVAGVCINMIEERNRTKRG